MRIIQTIGSTERSIWNFDFQSLSERGISDITTQTIISTKRNISNFLSRQFSRKYIWREKNTIQTKQISAGSVSTNRSHQEKHMDFLLEFIVHTVFQKRDWKGWARNISNRRFLEDTIYWDKHSKVLTKLFVSAHPRRWRWSKSEIHNLITANIVNHVI